MTDQPITTNYLSTRDFVVAFDQWARQKLPGYSRRSFARWAKVVSPNFVTLVINGARPLTEKWLEGFISAAKLPKEESLHLQQLSKFENTRSSIEREQLLLDIHKSLAKFKSKSLSYNQLELLTHPVAWTIYHMLDLVDQKSNPLWIKQRLRFLKIPGPDILQAFSILKSLGLVATIDGKLQSKRKQ